MPVAIVGAHRSGTSMVTQLLHRAGVHLGDPSDLLPSQPDNPEGFWENRRFIEINQALLNHLGAGWDFPPGGCPDWPAVGATSLVPKAALLLQAFACEEPWGWKDPRTSITLPFWLSLVPDLKVVVCIRNPLEVALSLAQRNGFSLALGINLWQTYNESILRATRPDQRIVTHYAACAANPAHELCRMVEFLGLQATNAEIDYAAQAARADLRHNRLTGWDLATSEVSADVVRLYGALCSEADAADLVSPDGVITAPRSVGLERTLRGAHAAGVLELSARPGPIGRINDAQFETELLRRHAARLDSQVASLESQEQQLRQSIAERDGAVVALQSTLAERDAAAIELQRALAYSQAAEARLADGLSASQLARVMAEKRVAEQGQELRLLRQQLTDLSARDAVRDSQIEALQLRLATTEEQLGELRASTAWEVVLQLWRVRNVLVPQGGKRDRTLWWLIRVYRLLSRPAAGPTA